MPDRNVCWPERWRSIFSPSTHLAECQVPAAAAWSATTTTTTTTRICFKVLLLFAFYSRLNLCSNKKAHTARAAAALLTHIAATKRRSTFFSRDRRGWLEWTEQRQQIHAALATWSSALFWLNQCILVLSSSSYTANTYREWEREKERASIKRWWCWWWQSVRHWWHPPKAANK